MTDQIDDKKVYITAEPMIPNENDEQGVVLVKAFKPGVFDQSIETVMQQLINPDGDDLNDGYNAVEKEAALVVQGWFQAANDQPDDYGVSVRGIKEDGQTIPVSLDKKLSDPEYASLIKTKEEVDPETNVKEKYKLVDFVMRRSVPSGSSLDYKLR